MSTESPTETPEAGTGAVQLEPLSAAIDPTADQAGWWRDAVIYEIYPRSFFDADGDGVGDLAGVCDRLDYLAALGIDAIWVCPFYPSPQADGGYDVSDYTNVDPELGDLDIFKSLVDSAHARNIRVIIDLIPNHTSDKHPWFRSALEAAPGSRARAMYWFQNGSGKSGNQPPTAWPSMFGGSAWTRVSDRDDAPGSPWVDDPQWYLHSFDATQPDLNWDEPAVREQFEQVLRFWLDRGVDGFRVDVAHGLVKSAQLRSHNDLENFLGTPDSDADEGMFDQEGVHEIYRTWRRLAESYQPERIFVAEANVSPERAARYVRPDELHQAFNFLYSETHWSAPALRHTIDRSLQAMESVGAPVTWVTSNHDIVRVTSRLGLSHHPGEFVPGIGPDDPQPDAALGLRRARALALLTLALPGSVYIYQGDELGLPEHSTLQPEDRQDPIWHRSKRTRLGRDGCRVPIPWIENAPAFGFSSTGAPWLPQPTTWSEFAVDAQSTRATSTLELFREAIRLRRLLGLGTGSLRWMNDGETIAGRLTFVNQGTQIITNFGASALDLPSGKLILTSIPFDRSDGLPADATVWMSKD